MKLLTWKAPGTLPALEFIWFAHDRWAEVEHRPDLDDLQPYRVGYFSPHGHAFVHVRQYRPEVIKSACDGLRVYVDSPYETPDIRRKEIAYLVAQGINRLSAEQEYRKARQESFNKHCEALEAWREAEQKRRAEAELRQRARRECAILRLNISTELRNLLVVEARILGDTYRGIGENWGISLERVRQICAKAERQLAHTKSKIYLRARLAKPIEIDPPSMRDRWHVFSLT